MSRSGLAVGIAGVSLVALAAGLAGQAWLLGWSAAVLVALLSVLGLCAPGKPSRATLAFLVAFAAVFCGLLALAFRLHDASGPLVLIGGFPAGTAVLVYGITPLGVCLGILYARVFDLQILPRDRSRAFLKRFSGR